MTTTDATFAEDRARMRAVIESFYERTSAKDLDSVLKLCTDDLRMRIPFDPFVSVREVVGKEAVRAVGKPALEWYDSYRQIVTGIEPMLDPDVWLVTVKGDLFVRSTGRAYRNDYLTVFRFRDGKIAEWTTYHDPIRQMVAFGATELPALADA
ncbi:nuclear transport factor 2 family protein [Nocardia sp. NPDC051570]|uniref:nuclear transport factor 2 family protein n=1 Tax=Nocardia sp. NPDC051570 TaxID=3364324 RepID=UPI0037A5A312